MFHEFEYEILNFVRTNNIWNIFFDKLIFIVNYNYLFVLLFFLPIIAFILKIITGNSSNMRKKVLSYLDKNDYKYMSGNLYNLGFIQVL